MTQHTPGPWEAIRLISVPDISITPAGSEMAIAAVTEVFGHPKEANARLIAAAPDLLQSLQNAWDRGYFDSHPDDSAAERDEKKSAIDLIERVSA